MNDGKAANELPAGHNQAIMAATGIPDQNLIILYRTRCSIPLAVAILPGVIISVIASESCVWCYLLSFVLHEKTLRVTNN